MLSPSSALISLLFITLSSIADSSSSTLGLQTDDPSSSSLASENYGPPKFPLINIEDDGGADLEIPISNIDFRQSEQSKSSNGCFSYNNMGNNRSNRRLRLKREGACGWSDQPRSQGIPSWTPGILPLAIGTYIAGGTLSDKWGVCGTSLSIVTNSIPVCTPVNLADANGDAMTSLREGPYTDLLMARLYSPVDPCRANDPVEALYCCHIVTYFGPDRNKQILYTSYDFSGRVCQKITNNPPARVVRPF